MTIWKDVPGFLNADPKYFENTIKINKIPFNEAIELAYYGASVIHPKTVKPIQNKGIQLKLDSQERKQMVSYIKTPADYPMQCQENTAQVLRGSHTIHSVLSALIRSCLFRWLVE